MESSYFQSNHRPSFSNKELKIPDNPIPFVKIKPKNIKLPLYLYTFNVIIKYAYIFKSVW